MAIRFKYISKQCYSGKDNRKFYQYTVIDEASREIVIYPYMNILVILLLILSNALLSTLVTNLKLFKQTTVLNLLAELTLI